jgi:hypothetical protein
MLIVLRNKQPRRGHDRAMYDLICYGILTND